MSIAYVDSSVVVGIAFRDSGWSALEQRLSEYQDLLSTNLLEAEVRAAYARMDVDYDSRVLSGIRWVFPDRPLTRELETVLEAGYLRGADLWHIAAAVYIASEMRDISFITLDVRQRIVAKTLGFQT